MNENKFELAVRDSERMILYFEEKLKKAIKEENWSKAADLKSYIGGMQQILAVLKLAD